MQGHLKAAAISVKAYLRRPWLCNGVTGKETFNIKVKCNLLLFLNRRINYFYALLICFKHLKAQCCNSFVHTCSCLSMCLHIVVHPSVNNSILCGFDMECVFAVHWTPGVSFPLISFCFIPSLLY